MSERPFSGGSDWACPACDGSKVDPEDESIPCRSCGGTGEYPGIANAWGQYGVSSVYVDTDGEDDSETPRRLVCIDTFMCETALTPNGARELVRRLEAAITEARGENDSITDLKDELGAMAHNCLGRAGLRTVGAVASASDEELLALPGFGVGCLAQTRRVIPRKGGENS